MAGGLVSFMTRGIRRVLHLLRRPQFDDDLREELEFHREQRRARLEQDGLDAAAAAAASTRALGNVALARDDAREVWISARVDELWQDVRYGARLLRKSPAFTAVAILTLALGIGATSATFSVVDAALWRPLRYPSADRLVLVTVGTSADSASVWHRLFDVVAAFNSREYALTGDDRPAQLVGQRVSLSLLPLLGVVPHSGPGFAADAFEPGHDGSVLISHRLWIGRFGGSPTVAGQIINLDDRSYTVAGVLPPTFTLFPDNDLVVPLPYDEAQVQRRDDSMVQLLARLRSGVTADQAQRELNALTPGPGPSVNVRYLRDVLVKDARGMLWSFWGAVGFLLLTAVANFANLLLTRSAARGKELAVRTAIGAGGARIARQLLTETLMLSAGAGLAGLALAYLGLRAIVAVSADQIPRLDEAVVDGPVVAFAIGLSIAVGLIVGLVPSRALRRAALPHFLKSDGGGSAIGIGPDRPRVRAVLVVIELGLAFVLLVGAGLLTNSFWRLRQVPLGFAPDRLLTVRLEFPWAKWARADISSLLERLGARLQHLPGVVAVAQSSSLPLTQTGGIGTFAIEDQPSMKARAGDLPFGVPGPPPPPPPPAGTAKGGAPPPPFVPGPLAFRANVSAGYFHTMGIAVKQGREFDLGDREGSLAVAIVNEAMERRYWPDQTAIGRRLKIGGPQATWPWRTIVGVVGDVKRFDLEHDASPEFYIPVDQAPEETRQAIVTTGAIRVIDAVNLTARTSGPPGALVDAVQRALWELDPTMPIKRILPMEDMLAAATARRRLNMLVFGLFAGTALVVAAMGLYGVLASIVHQRTREIGVRVALGASTLNVLSLVFRLGIRLTLIGMAVGGAAAMGVTRAITGLLFGVKPLDAPTFAAVGALLGLVALAACYVPARRAARVDPIVALRAE